MRHAEQVVAIALPFVWLGLVLGISVIETPLKFRAPGMTTPLAVGIGRLVFRALNRVELAIAGALVLVLVARHAHGGPYAVLALLVAALLLQVLWLRPVLDRRALRVIGGEEVPASSLHVAYVMLEGVKLVALPLLGALLAARWLA